jgi:hypothetical protein
MGLGIPMVNSANVASYKEPEHKFLYVFGYPTYENGYEIDPDAWLYDTPEKVAESIGESFEAFVMLKDGVWMSYNALCIIRLKYKITS